MRSSLVNKVPLFAVLTALSCSETLPPYEDPRNIINGTVVGHYSLTNEENILRVTLWFKNGYDETLEGNAVLTGEGTITWLRDPSVKKTFTISSSHLISGNYDPSSSVLRMDPQSTIRFAITWDFIDDSGRDLRHNGFMYVDDSGCASRRIGFEETFVIRAEVKVYEKIRPVLTTVSEFTMCHITRWVDSKVCTPVITHIPCGLRR